jgi:hypothetical protein
MHVASGSPQRRVEVLRSAAGSACRSRRKEAADSESAKSGKNVRLSWLHTSLFADREGRVARWHICIPITNFWSILEGLGKQNVGVFYGNRYILWLFDIFLVAFGTLHQKIWQPYWKDFLYLVMKFLSNLHFIKCNQSSFTLGSNSSYLYWAHYPGTNHSARESRWHFKKY